MLYVYSSNIRTGHFADLEKWLGESQNDFAAAQPQSWKLLGIYFTAFGLGPAHVEIHWEIEKYASFDVAHANASQGTAFNTFLNKLHSFLDPATGSARLLKAVAGGGPEFRRIVAQDAARIVGC
jgi:hypothetical protein